jgi:hypothetical protein
MKFLHRKIFPSIFFDPVRIWVRIYPPHPLVCRKRRMNGARSFGWDRKNRGSVSQKVWHDKDPSLLKGHERRTYLPKFCSPSPVMVTSPYKWKILERDVKPPIINQSILIGGHISSLPQHPSSTVGFKPSMSGDLYRAVLTTVPLGRLNHLLIIH